jgi:hypothetical protein
VTNATQTRRDALARSICARLCDERRSIDELRVIDRVLSRLEAGADIYGALKLAADMRAWNREAAYELTDWIFYAACREIVRDDERGERLLRDTEHDLGGEA